MSSEHENVDPQTQDAASGGADDLSAALGEQDATFVSTEKKQQVGTGTLVVGGMIALAAAATYFMYLRNGPSAAVAANPAAASADATITQFLSNDSQNAERMRQLLKDTEKAVQQFQQQPAKTQVPLDDLKTNPFKTDAATATNDAAEKAAEKKRREETLKAVAALKVQSIMSGKRKAVMINNVLYAEGESVQGFLIERINAGDVVVKSEAGGRFALKMQK